MRTVPCSPLVAPFAGRLLALDLPGLPADRRDRIVSFVVHRVDTLPSVTRIGVLLIAGAVRAALAIPALAPRAVAFLAGTGLPLLGEYPRLVRSLGYAYLWDNWPDSAPDGSPGTAEPMP